MKDIKVEDLKQRLDNNDDLVLVDVRESSEKKVSDLGGIHIPLGQFADRYDELEKYKEEGKDVVIYCRSGGRSGQATMFLERNGYENVYNLRGGINEWATKVDDDMPTY